MNFIVWFVLGGFIGWIVSISIDLDNRRKTILNIAVGIVGALLGGGVISPLIDGGVINPDNLDFTAFMDAIVGAEILLALTNFVRRSTVRESGDTH